jgi:hypothetical protein
VLVDGEGELGSSAGRHYVLIEGPDAKVHLVYYSPALEEARSRGRLRPNSFIRLRKQFENGRGFLRLMTSVMQRRYYRASSFLLALGFPSRDGLECPRPTCPDTHSDLTSSSPLRAIAGPQESGRGLPFGWHID